MGAQPSHRTCPRDTPPQVHLGTQKDTSPGPQVRFLKHWLGPPVARAPVDLPAPGTSQIPLLPALPLRQFPAPPVQHWPHFSGHQG